MTTLLMIVITLIMLSMLIVVHEWGHYIMARRMGVFVEEFSIGMGPLLFKKQGKETQFSIRALPLGGFCKMRGEQFEEDEEGNAKMMIDPDDPRSYCNKTKGQRFLILVAGPAMNIIFAYVLLFISRLMHGETIIMAVVNAGYDTVAFGSAIYQGLAMLLTGQAGLNEMAGPIGMVSMVHSFFEQGIMILMRFAAMISVNLGIMNLLPIPALDGGQILIIIIEKIIRRDIDPQKAGIINTIGFMALMLFSVVVAVNDVFRIVG